MANNKTIPAKDVCGGKTPGVKEARGEIWKAPSCHNKATNLKIGREKSCSLCKTNHHVSEF